MYIYIYVISNTYLNDILWCPKSTNYFANIHQHSPTQSFHHSSSQLFHLPITVTSCRSSKILLGRALGVFATALPVGRLEVVVRLHVLRDVHHRGGQDQRRPGAELLPTIFHVASANLLQFAIEHGHLVRGFTHSKCKSRPKTHIPSDKLRVCYLNMPHSVRWFTTCWRTGIPSGNLLAIYSGFTQETSWFSIVMETLTRWYKACIRPMQHRTSQEHMIQGLF